MTALCWPITSCRKVGWITWGARVVGSVGGSRSPAARRSRRSSACWRRLLAVGVVVSSSCSSVCRPTSRSARSMALTVLVDDLDPLEEPVERLALAHIGAYSRQLPAAFELGPHLVDRGRRPAGRPRTARRRGPRRCTRCSSASATARSARSTLADISAASRSSAVSCSDVLPVMASHCSAVRPWAWSRRARSWARWFSSWPTSASGISASTRPARASPVRSRTAAWAWDLRTIADRSREVDSRSSAMVSNSEFSAAQASSASGSTRSRTLLTRTLNRSWRVLVGVGVGGVELEDVAGLGPA